MSASTELSTSELRAFGAELLSGRVIYFPIRHHSPACAFHLKKVIAERNPKHILIEGPTSFDRFIDLLGSPKAKPPLALYSYCTEKVTDSEAFQRIDGKLRRGAYYPMCDYSPEWVAVREGRRIGAAVHFIDLDFHQQLCVDETDRLSGRLSTFLSEKYFQKSEYLRRLAAQLHCRSHDELWDRLFESWYQILPTESFVSEVAAYCRLARHDVSQAVHDHDGTSAREGAMAWHIKKVVKNSEGSVLVVTGGYHTVVLPELVEAECKMPEIDTSRVTNPDAVMIRYSFDRLDRMLGYAAGMPAPAFYQRVWEDNHQETEVNRKDLVLDVISEVAHICREKGLDNAPTASTVMAAYEHVHHLSQLRGNPAPTRNDLIDSMLSCFVKGASNAEGRILIEIILNFLTGSAVGEIPTEAGSPPIVSDFYYQAKKYRLKISDSESKKLSLDIYREENAQRLSRFLHVLQFLEVPFASKLSGPQLTSQRVGRRLQEHWEYAWTPQCEAALVDSAIFGTSLHDATANKFMEELRETNQDGKSRSALSAVQSLSEALVLGLHDIADGLIGWLRLCVHEDPSIPSAAGAVAGLALIWESREPLGAQGLAVIPQLARNCYERACYLLNQSASGNEQEAVNISSALVELRSCLQGSHAEWFDEFLFYDATEKLTQAHSAHPVLAGAAAGILYASGKWSEEKLGSALTGRTTRRLDPHVTTAFIRGVTISAKEGLWQSEAVFNSLREVVENTEDQEFLLLLPELRLAFSTLTPRESDQLGEQIANFLGVKSLGAMIAYEVNEAEVQLNLQISSQLQEVLARDGLESWNDAGGGS